MHFFFALRAKQKLITCERRNLLFSSAWSVKNSILYRTTKKGPLDYELVILGLALEVNYMQSKILLIFVAY